MEEEFKSLKGLVECGDNYEVSNTGNVRNIKTQRVLKPDIHTFGYHQVKPSLKGKTKNCLIHRAVALAFIPNEDNKPEVNHIDGNKANNHVTNLEWVTSKENQEHAVRTGLQKFIRKSPVIKKLKQVKPLKKVKLESKDLTQTDLYRIHILLTEGVSQSIIAKAFDVHPSFIHRVKENTIPKPEQNIIKERKLTGLPLREANTNGYGIKVLTEDDVRQIKSLYSTGNYSQNDIGSAFGVSRKSIGNIINGKTWKHVV